MQCQWGIQSERRGPPPPRQLKKKKEKEREREGGRGSQTRMPVDAGREVGMAQFKCKASSNLEARFPESFYDPVLLDSEDASLQIFSLDEFRWD